MQAIFLLFRIFLQVRYRITLSGIEHLKTDAPIVVFPNHPALIEPIILSAFIGKYKILSPVVTETYFHTPGLEPLLKQVWAIPVWDIARGGTIEDVKKAFLGINEWLKTRKNVLLYPSGHIYVQPFEHIVGKKMGFEVIRELPKDARVICIRTKGLWGSMWGKAYTGDSPSLAKIIPASLGMMIANLFFFMPKREVSITIEDMTEEVKKWHKQGMDSFNTELEDYYNMWWEEPCRFISHYFFRDDTVGKTEPESIVGSVKEIKSSSSVPREDIPDEVYDKIIWEISEIKNIEEDELSYDTNLILDLHADSLDMAEIKAAIQMEFPSTSNPPITTLKTIGDFCTMAIGRSPVTETLKPCHFREVSDENIVLDIDTENDTIPSCIEKICRSDPKALFLYDGNLGEMTRGDFLLKSYVIGEYLKKYTSPRIGIMLPALGATSLLLNGTYVAGKVPVMLNWTVGERSFAHCMEFANLETILTSRRFYEKISSPWLSTFENKMIFIEDILRDISSKTKLFAVINMKLRRKIKTPEEAVILFTSGSESLPKAVALTHKNILTDIIGALELVPFKKYETLIGFLPPFHSFGFTINTIFPLIAPIQVAYTPDPNDARTIVECIKHTHTSILPATPTFLRMILREADEWIESLRYAFVGAEKCGDEVFDLFHTKCPDGVILEGYGITECSPIVTINPLSKPLKGSAGKFLPSLAYSIRDINTGKQMNSGEQWMIYVSGDSIFEGYLDTTLESPFEISEEKKWYKTWDLGYVDTEWYLFITWRLKRFVKIAGEMISLPFIETILLEKYGNTEVTSLAVEAREVDGTTIIVAFTTFDTTTAELNDYIHMHGASNIVKFSHVVKLESIPILGTGKTDYKQIKALI